MFRLAASGTGWMGEGRGGGLGGGGGFWEEGRVPFDMCMMCRRGRLGGAGTCAGGAAPGFQVRMCRRELQA